MRKNSIKEYFSFFVSRRENSVAFLIHFSRPFFVSVIILFLSITLQAQEKQSIQIKTFDQKLKPLGNIEISINDMEYVSVGNKGSVIVELNSSELPIKGIKIKDDKLEAASWNLSKGIVEIIVRPKNYYLAHFKLRFSNGNPASSIKLTFRGSKVVTITSNPEGEFDLPLPLNEKVTSINQFQFQDLRATKMNLSDSENVIFIERPKVVSTQEKKAEITSTVKEDFSHFDLDRLDSIQSLTVFYAVFKDVSIKSFDEESRARIDAKFNQLLLQRDGIYEGDKPDFIRNISDSSFLAEDLKNLLNQSTLESNLLETNREDFESKIKMISEKLERGVTNLTKDERMSLLRDLDLLEKMLIENESKFYQNQNDYREIIDALREKYFDTQKLEDQLSIAEKERDEEQRTFRQRLMIGGVILLIFAILIILLITFSNRVRRQSNDLKSANEEIKTINENLEEIVVKRTKLLEESNKELDTFLYRASHDLRSPIRSILGLFYIIDHIPQSELVVRVKATTLGMDNMLKKLIVISEISSKSKNREAINICSAINHAKSELLEFINESGVQFHCDCDEAIQVEISPALLSIVLNGLLENAIFFSALKGKEHARVEVGAFVKNKNVVISIYDNGVGIDESIRSKIFDMFFMGHEKSEGNGLGLYTVRKCVQAMHGKIEVESEVGRYTKFIVSIPM